MKNRNFTVVRPNKVAYHYQRTAECRGRRPSSRDLLTLAVKGTLDVLAPSLVYKISKVISKEHPTDKGYFKKVVVLSEYGKKLLIKKRFKVGKIVTYKQCESIFTGQIVKTKEKTLIVIDDHASIELWNAGCAVGSEISFSQVIL